MAVTKHRSQGKVTACSYKKTVIGMQFPLNLKHLISDCNLDFSYNIIIHFDFRFTLTGKTFLKLLEVVSSRKISKFN